ncbi:MAG: SoxR reducing system RseC family protein [Oscillospiraceae bacterium]|nr:SoxR reducing system RseC family protein [Oscillospiraceae bacterium]
MKQKVMVLSTSGNMARVSYRRPTACHGDCSKCAGGCGSMAAKEEIIVSAENLIGAKIGDSVYIEGETKKVAWAIVLVYVIPVVLFLTGYFLGQQWGCGNLIGVLGFFLGLALAVLESRRQKKRGQEIRYQIVSYA